MDTGPIAMPKSTLVLPASQVTPEPSLEKRTRRRFTADYKLCMLAEADACKHGELGAMLRREKLYSNQLSAWRREYGERGVDGLHKSMPGPTASKTPEQRQNEQLRKENGRLKRKLEMANDR
jgi:transposase-like protein